MNDQLSKQPRQHVSHRASDPVDGMSLGAQRVRESFNPSLSTNVDKIKRYTADLIDLVEDLRGLHGGVLGGEHHRLVALAQSAYEEAAMWAVKAATTSKP